MTDTSGTDTIKSMDRTSQIMDAVSPIFDQLKSGVGDKNIPEGGVFNPYVRGYIFGYINNLIAFKGGGSIDTNPSAAVEIFNVMFGSPYSNDNEGGNMFNQCLADKNASDNTEFTQGFLAGESDHSIIAGGTSIHKLSDYLTNILC